MPAITASYNVPFSCDVGDLIRLFSDFTNIDQLPIDPDFISVRIKQPDGTILTYEGYNPGPIVRTALGHFYLDVSVSQSGTWYYRWEAAGQGQCAAEKTFMAKASYFSYVPPVVPPPSLEAEVSAFHYDTTESVYSGAPARTVMKSFLIPIDVIIPDKMLHIMGGGRFAANAQTKTIAINLGPTLLDELEDSIGNNNGGWLIDVKLTYRSSSELVGRIEFKFLNSSGIVVKDYHFPYAVAAPPFTFSVSGESPTDGNITQQQLVAYLIG